MAHPNWSRWRRFAATLANLVERDLPTLAFASLFVVFMVQIIWRYFVVPLTWTMEFTLMAFIWTTVLGACLAQREDEHVAFTLLYDGAKPETQRIIRILGNGLVIISFIIALGPSARWINFMGFKRSDALKIPMNIAYSPFVVFLLVFIVRLGTATVRDVVGLIRKGSRR